MKSRMLQLGMWPLCCFIVGLWPAETVAANAPVPNASRKAVSKRAPASKSAAKKKAPAKTYAKSKTRVARPVTWQTTSQELENQRQMVESVNAVSKPERLMRLWASAQQFLNVPYKLGANSLQGTDCSGYTSTVYRDLGVQLPRTAHQQFSVGAPVNKEELALGDLVFFGTRNLYATHVGLYIGDGKFMHASSGYRRVRIDRLTPMLGNRWFLGGKRFLTEEQANAASDETLTTTFTDALEAAAEPSAAAEHK